MEIDYDGLCTIVAIPLCLAILALLYLYEAGAALKSCRCGGP